MAWLRHVGSTGEDKGLDKALSRLRAGWHGLIVKPSHEEAHGKASHVAAIESNNDGGDIVRVKFSPARFSLSKAVRVKLLVGPPASKAGRRVVEEKKPSHGVRRCHGDQVVRLSVVPARFGRRAVKVRMSVEEVATGPVRVHLTPARFGERVKVHLKVLVDGEEEMEGAQPGCIGGHRHSASSSPPARSSLIPAAEAPTGPVSVRLTTNWRGRVKVHTTVKEASHEDRLVQLQLHQNLLTRRVVAKIVVL
uniref:Uncharacterized protein n=1 Tax=Tetraselmis chuii TaxID=63592 RepID=A0A7S1X4X6_9CHLO|mmetsp:Transcript_32572/g.58315  ORF Transcript_32572/g.58315 Transcript_32572/m.58315 type:complete len:250 (+) Transcript_32572:294-1043(+)